MAEAKGVLRVRMMSSLCLLLAALIVCALAGPAGAVTGPVKILGGREAQYLPYVNDTYLIWSQNSLQKPTRSNAFARPLGTTNQFRLNPRGTQGYTGGIEPGTNVAIYQQIGTTGSDLFLFDLDTRQRTKLPAPVNTVKWEWSPRISNSYILFERNAGTLTKLFLFDRISLTTTLLDAVDRSRVFLIGGDVGEQYASWTICGRVCSAFLYDISGATRTKLPAPIGRHQYAPSVDEINGNVYYVRSGEGCGNHAGIWRRSVDLLSPPVRMVSLPPGIDTGWTIALDQDVAHSRLDAWFEYWRCTPKQGDIYELRELDDLIP